MIASVHQNPQRPNLPLLGFAAYSGTGKTTLLEALLPKLTAAGLRIGLLKHAHHDFDVDKPGKDSYRLRKAGASQMLIASRNRHALMTETPDAEAEFDYLLTRFDAEKLDVILVEGCKNIAFPKIELHARKSVSLGFTLMMKTSLRLLRMKRSKRICRKCTLMISMRSLISFCIMLSSGMNRKRSNLLLQI